MAVTIVLKHKQDSDCIAFENPSATYLQAINHELEKCDQKNNGYVSVTITRPRRPRTTGDKSQNNLFYLLVTKISNETGNDIEDVKDGVKYRAIKRGYPYSVNKLSGTIKPYSTTRVDTVQMSYLIDECYQVCSELGIYIEGVE